MSDLKGLFGLVAGVNFGPLVSSETCLRAKEKEERLMILADNVEEVLDISGPGSFLKHCCKVDGGIVGNLGVVLKEKNCFFGFAVAVVVLEIVADAVDVSGCLGGVGLGTVEAWLCSEFVSTGVDMEESIYCDEAEVKMALSFVMIDVSSLIFFAHCFMTICWS